jgi:cation diffusion facilitator family transporter
MVATHSHGFGRSVDRSLEGGPSGRGGQPCRPDRHCSRTGRDLCSDDSVALFADLIHNFGDALTAVPLGAAFLFRSSRGERWAGYFVVLVILFSACVALYGTILRLIHPEALSHLWALAGAGAVGFIGNEVAALVRLRAGHRLDSPALVADGYHARTDGFVSLGVVASAVLVAFGAEIADPLIGLAMTIVILRITWQSWITVRHGQRRERRMSDP